MSHSFNFEVPHMEPVKPQGIDKIPAIVVFRIISNHSLPESKHIIEQNFKNFPISSGDFGMFLKAYMDHIHSLD